jgi:hypothetical protein
MPFLRLKKIIIVHAFSNSYLSYVGDRMGKEILLAENSDSSGIMTPGPKCKKYNMLLNE